MMGDMCPMKVQGAAVSVSDVEGGVTLAFLTSTGDVAELRRRVHQMAEMHERHQSGRMEMGRSHGGSAPGHPMRGGMMGMAHEPMVKSTATAEDIEGGARIVLRPVDPNQLEALRGHIRAHAERMTRGECPMSAALAPAAP